MKHIMVMDKSEQEQLHAGQLMQVGSDTWVQFEVPPKRLQALQAAEAPRLLEHLPHICPECHKGYGTYSGLYSHRIGKHGYKAKAHKPKLKRQFRCDRCGARFDSKNGLGVHIQRAHVKNWVSNPQKKQATKKEVAA